MSSRGALRDIAFVIEGFSPPIVGWRASTSSVPSYLRVVDFSEGPTYVKAYAQLFFAGGQTMIPKTISPTDLRKNLYAVVKDVAAGKAQYLVTPSEGESVVICSRAEYTQILEERELLRDLRAAEADIKAGRLIPHEAVMKELRALHERTFPKDTKRRN